MVQTYKPINESKYVTPANSPCLKCEKLDENCTKYRTCKTWREWFHDEWSDIQRAGEIAKKRREKTLLAKERIRLATVNTRPRQK
jgi:hypothetical protein